MDLKTDFIEQSYFDESENKMINNKIYDNTQVLEQNKFDRNSGPDFGKYKGNMVKVGSLHKGDVERLCNMGYNILSGDPEEAKRALLYIQENEPYLLTVSGKPISKKRLTW